MGRTILLVDDDVTLRGLLADALEREGFAVLQAGNGEEAVAVALGGGPDIVISDILMPQLDGWELCQMLRTLPSTKTVPFVFLSSLDQAPERILGLRLGADAYLTKPFHLDEILATVHRLAARVEDRRRLVEAGQAAPAGEDGLESILVDTVEFLRATGRTGLITVNAGPFEGEIYLEKGALRHASLGARRGEEALLGMLRLPGSKVTFKEGSLAGIDPNMELSWEDFMTSLLGRGE